MDGINWTIVIAAASLEIVIISAACGIVWKLSRSEIAQRSETDQKIAAVKAEADQKTAVIHADANKTIIALTEKIYEVEIWARDEFVRKGSFELVIARIEKSVEKIADRIDAKFDELTKRFAAKN